MKKIFDFTQVGLVVALGASLSGCAGLTATTITADEQTFIQAAQAAATGICGFLPTADAIAAVFTDANAVAASAEAVGQLICTAFTAPTASMKLAKRKMGLASGGLPVIVINGHSYQIQGSKV